jgi:hypothetical protein
MSGRKNFGRLRDELRAKPEYREMLQREHDARERQIVDAWESSQANVSQIEHTADIYLSTLRSYVEALGGRLEINAVFPDETIGLMPGAEQPSLQDETPARKAAAG